MSDDENKDSLDEFGGGDDFADDFGDDFSDDFGDDFSDELSEDDAGFEQAGRGSSEDDFEDETVVYDEESANETDSPFAAAQGTSLQEYKKYIIMAFSLTLCIVFGVLMLGKKKKPVDSFGSVKAPQSSPSDFSSSDMMSKQSNVPMQGTQTNAALEALKNKMQNAQMGSKYDNDVPTPEPKSSMQMPMQSGVTSSEIKGLLEETKMMSSRLAEFQAHFDSNRTSFQSIASNINTLEASLREAKTTLIKLDEKMASLKGDLSKQSALIKKLEEKKKPKKAMGKDMEMVSIPVYNLYAAIPGRAWLKSDSGTTITVAVGSNIPGYGKVSYIEPIKGVVATSSGQIFKFQDR